MAARPDWTKYRIRVRNLIAQGHPHDDAHKIAAAEKDADVTARQQKLDETMAKKLAQSKTCQICGRSIFAEVGLIAHHGYERPGTGWQTDSCEGARELPFENAKNALVKNIEALHVFLAAKQANRKRIADETATFTRSYERLRKDATGKPIVERGRQLRDEIHVSMKRDTFVATLLEHPGCFRYSEAKYSTPAWHDGVLNESFNATVAFDHFKGIELAHRDEEIRQLASHIKRQESRRDGWVQTHVWDDTNKTWKKV